MTKHALAHDDPELLATYAALAAETRDVTHAHIDELTRHLGRIIGAGVAQGEFHADDVEVAAKAVFDATAKFHHPSHAAEWSSPGVDEAYAGVRDLVLAALGVVNQHD